MRALPEIARDLLEITRALPEIAGDLVEIARALPEIVGDLLEIARARDALGAARRRKLKKLRMSPPEFGPDFSIPL
jgi:hypothetical protein